MGALGRAQEVFAAAEPIKAWYAQLFNGELTSSSFNPYLAASYRLPTVDASLVPNSWVPTLAAKQALNGPIYQNATTWVTPNYAEVLIPAIAAGANETNGAAAWAFMNLNELLTDTGLQSDTRWAIVPRSTSGTAGPTQLNACDLNSDGVNNAVDVQLAVNQTVGVSACSNAILDGTTSCSIIDIQRIVMAALTGICRVGS
jgi:hypothetical protein